MPNKTTNYNLNKPLDTDFYDIAVQNENMDIIDTQLKNAHNHRNAGLATEAGIHGIRYYNNKFGFFINNAWVEFSDGDEVNY